MLDIEQDKTDFSSLHRCAAKSTKKNTTTMQQRALENLFHNMNRLPGIIGSCREATVESKIGGF